MSLHVYVSFVLCFIVLPVRAGEKLTSLKVGSEVYSNVTVTRVTATDVFFMHARGVGNAKLKNLDPEWQKHFRYDPEKANEAAKKQAAASAQYHREVATAKPPLVAPKAEAKPDPATAEVDIKVSKINARSFLGQLAPKFAVEKWVTETPNTSGKYVLIDFWATWCGPCRQSIPHLNALQRKFAERLIIIGLSDETEQTVRGMKSPKIDYSVAVDTQGRMLHAVEVTGIPHAMLIDPQGIVRFEGMPSYLTEQGLERLLDKYSR